MKRTDEAIARMTKEAGDNVALIMLEEHFTDLCTNDAVADKLLVPGKTLAGALKEIENEAGKHRTGKVGIVSDKKGFEIAENYFGIIEEKKYASNAASTIDVSDFL